MTLSKSAKMSCISHGYVHKDDDLENLSVKGLISCLKSTFRDSEFARVERIIVLREEVLRNEIEAKVKESSRFKEFEAAMLCRENELMEDMERNDKEIILIREKYDLEVLNRKAIEKENLELRAENEGLKKEKCQVDLRIRDIELKKLSAEKDLLAKKLQFDEQEKTVLQLEESISLLMAPKEKNTVFVEAGALVKVENPDPGCQSTAPGARPLDNADSSLSDGALMTLKRNDNEVVTDDCPSAQTMEQNHADYSAGFAIVKRILTLCKEVSDLNTETGVKQNNPIEEIIARMECRKKVLIHYLESNKNEHKFIQEKHALEKKAIEEEVNKGKEEMNKCREENFKLVDLKKRVMRDKNEGHRKKCDIECDKLRAESDILVWKTKCDEQENRVSRLEENSNLRLPSEDKQTGPRSKLDSIKVENDNTAGERRPMLLWNTDPAAGGSLNSKEDVSNILVKRKNNADVFDNCFKSQIRKQKLSVLTNGDALSSVNLSSQGDLSSAKTNLAFFAKMKMRCQDSAKSSSKPH